MKSCSEINDSINAVLNNGSIRLQQHQHNAENITTVADTTSPINNEFNDLTVGLNLGPSTNLHKQEILQESYVWELRSRSLNLTPASTVLNSPDLNTDLQYTLHPSQHHANTHSHQHYHHQHHHLRQYHHHHQICVGHSPGSQYEQKDLLPQGFASPGSPTDVGKGDGQCLHDGEIVVFDDIDTNWMNKSTNNDQNMFKITASNSNIQNNVVTACADLAAAPEILTNSMAATTPNYNYSPSYHNSDDVLKVTKMIGQLPIADYEGSPRRFGTQARISKNCTPKNVTKRPPGFPQRVSSTASQQHQRFFTTTHICSNVGNNNNVNEEKNSNKSIGNLIDLNDHDDVSNSQKKLKTKTSKHSPTFDYLYEFSETRKVLEEFFKENSDDEKRFTEYTEIGDDSGNVVNSNLTDTQQEIVTHNFGKVKPFEQSYIGQRLARIPKEELLMIHRSPLTPLSNQSICNEHNEIELFIDSNSRSSEDLGDNEMEANLRRHSRNFTLSPETTDYDSNCGDLDSLSNDINCTTDYGKLYTSMPVLEDGLSSGHASDTENNMPSVCGIQQQQDQQKQEQQHEKHSNNRTQPEQQLQERHSTVIGSLFQSNSTPDLNKDPNLQHPEQPKILIKQQELQQQQNTNKLLVKNDAHAIHFVQSDCDPKSLINNLGDLKAEIIKPQQTQESCTDIFIKNDEAFNEVLSTEDKQYFGNTIHPAADEQSSTPPKTVPFAKNSHRPLCSKQLSLSQQQQRIIESVEIQEAMKEIRSALQRAKTQPEKLKFCDEVLPPDPDSPVWVPRKGVLQLQQLVNINMALGANNASKNHIQKLHLCGNSIITDEEEQDTDLETDRLLGQQRHDEQDFFEDKNNWQTASCIGGDTSVDISEQSNTTATDLTLLSNNNHTSISSSSNNNANISCGTNSSTSSNGGSAVSNSIKPKSYSSAIIRQGVGTSLTPKSSDVSKIITDGDVSIMSPEKLQYSKSPTGSLKSIKDTSNSDKKNKSRNKEGLWKPKVLIEGVLFRARYLGSTQLVCEGQPTKSTRMMQAEEAVSRIKAPEGESQPSTEVDLFISTEKIMVLNTDLKEIMMDHALRTISYIADIGDLVVLMARRRFIPISNSNGSCTGLISNIDASNSDTDMSASGISKGSNNFNIVNSASTISNEIGCGTARNGKHNRTPKMICHVFESDEAQFIAQSIGQAFQVAYMEFLKANGIENENLAKEMDYQEVLNSQEIFGDELEIFAKKELQKEVVVPKAKGEILGVVIVESGWGSMLPTVVIANLMSGGAAARCGQLNIGDQLIAINGMSLVGLPLSTCQSYIRNAKNQTAVKFTVVPCPPVVEVKILRPKALFQLGFSVQNGVICSLLRGGIAERGGVRVGHRIIEINNQSVVAVPHDTIVKLLSSSVGEILMKTMPTSMFRLLTGQETPIYI